MVVLTTKVLLEMKINTRTHTLIDLVHQRIYKNKNIISALLKRKLLVVVDVNCLYSAVQYTI